MIGSIIVGSSNQAVNVVLDTGSSWTWLAHDKCATCNDLKNKNWKGAKFNSFGSSSFRQKTPKLSQTVYGKGTVVGWDSKDKICSAIGGSCVPSFSFNTIIYEEDLKGFQGTGMIGLAPN